VGKPILAGNCQGENQKRKFLSRLWHLIGASLFLPHIERFNNTLRQRVSRLVRETLSFSKILENHIGAIKFFQIPPDLVVEFQRIDIIEVI
jgi:hypothetical protein